MKIPKFVLILLAIMIIGGGFYIFNLKNSLENSSEKTTSVVEVTRGNIVNSIEQRGTAELANEQKLRFPQSGKVAEIFVKTGDNVKKWAVLASLDKREFYQELSQIKDKIATTQKNITEEIEKANGVESKKLEREIASMERKLAEMEEDLSRAVQNSPFKAEEKQLDINAKKRELEGLKNKFSLDEKTYNSEKNNSEKLIKSKIEDGRKVVKNTIENTSSEYSDMKTFHSEINKIFAFNPSSLSSEERSNAYYVATNAPGLRWETENLWKESERMIRDYNNFIFRINENSANASTAEGITNETIRTYQKLFETADMARRAVESTQVGDGHGITQSELNSLKTTIAGVRNSVQSKINSLKSTRDDILVVNSPEKIREKFLADLAEKKNALDALRDSIIKTENTISQEEKNIQVDGFRITDKTLKREIADKQSAILDQKDAILNKKEELKKMLSGKSETLENLRNSLKDQQSSLEKMLTKEESYEIRAPFSGTIRAIKVQVGDIIGSESSTTEKFVLLENSELINIKITLNQLDITKVSLGQQAEISFEAVPEAILTGKITEISSTPARSESGNSASSYEVVISAERGEYAIYSGMNAQVKINLDSRENVVLVPITALSDDVNTGEQYVNVVSDSGEIIKTPVQTGQKSNGKIEIISGVDEGKKIQVIDFNANNYTSNDFTSTTGF